MQFWSTILATVVGGILAIGGWFAGKIYERQKERKSLRAALRAEIQAILAIVERRDYIARLSEFIGAIRAGSTGFFEIRNAKDYDMVFRSNCSKLGLLPPETVTKMGGGGGGGGSIVEDLVLLRDAGESPGLQTRYRLNTEAGNLAFHEQMRELSIETVALGNDLIQELA